MFGIQVIQTHPPFGSLSHFVLKCNDHESENEILVWVEHETRSVSTEQF